MWSISGYVIEHLCLVACGGAWYCPQGVAVHRMVVGRVALGQRDEQDQQAHLVVMLPEAARVAMGRKRAAVDYAVRNAHLTALGLDRRLSSRSSI